MRGHLIWCEQVCAGTTPPLHHHYTTTTPPSLHHYYTTTTPLLHHYFTTTTPLLLHHHHHYTTTTTPLINHHYTTTTRAYTMHIRVGMYWNFSIKDTLRTGIGSTHIWFWRNLWVCERWASVCPQNKRKQFVLLVCWCTRALIWASVCL